MGKAQALKAERRLYKRLALDDTGAVQSLGLFALWAA
jgi:hypothetical protein